MGEVQLKPKRFLGWISSFRRHINQYVERKDRHQNSELQQRKMASLQISVPHLAGTRFKRRPVRCTSERQELFNRIAPVYDNVSQLSLSIALFNNSSPPCHVCFWV